MAPRKSSTKTKKSTTSKKKNTNTRTKKVIEPSIPNIDIEDIISSNRDSVDTYTCNSYSYAHYPRSYDPTDSWSNKI